MLCKKADCEQRLTEAEGSAPEIPLNASNQEQGESDNQNDDNIPDDKTEHQNDETNQGVEMSFGVNNVA